MLGWVRPAHEALITIGHLAGLDEAGLDAEDDGGGGEEEPEDRQQQVGEGPREEAEQLRRRRGGGQREERQVRELRVGGCVGGRVHGWWVLGGGGEMPVPSLPPPVTVDVGNEGGICGRAMAPVCRGAHLRVEERTCV